MKLSLSATLITLFVGGAAGFAEEKSGDAEKKEISEVKKTVVIGASAPKFRIKDSSGKQIDLKQLTDQ